MPIKFDIDKQLGRVNRKMSGKLTADDFIAYSNSLRADKDFRSDYMELSDLLAVEGISIDYGSMRVIVSRCPFDFRSRRAFVAGNDLSYGIAQMFRGMARGEHGEVEVFRDLHEAELWLISN